MGCDIHVVEQCITKDGWVRVNGLATFGWRSYGMYGFLADVRNYSAVPPISPRRGLPDDYKQSDEEDFDFLHSHSWLSIEELLSFDYDQEFEDRRVTIQTGPNSWHGGATAEPGGGERTTYREFLGEEYFESLEVAANAGVDRIVFGFDD